jgi:putative FmdB family regulatory protein
MPNYEYRCLSCGKVFEALQKFSDPQIETHAECGGAVERLISVSAIQFKGSGFYINDYAKGNGKSSDKGEGSDKSDKSKSDAKSEGGKSEKKDSGGESKGKSESSSSSSSSSDGGSSSSTPSAPAAPSSSSSDKK